MIYLEQTDESSDIVVKNAATQHETSVFGT